VQEGEVAPTKPKDKAFNERHQPKKLKPINKAKGEKKMEIKNTSAKASLTSLPPKRTKKVWRVKRASSESSTPGPDELRLIEQSEESRSRTLNDEPSPRSKPVLSHISLSIFLFCASIMFKFQICF
jgi:hypothetical protein